MGQTVIALTMTLVNAAAAGRARCLNKLFHLRVTFERRRQNCGLLCLPFMPAYASSPQKRFKLKAMTVLTVLLPKIMTGPGLLLHETFQRWLL